MAGHYPSHPTESSSVHPACCCSVDLLTSQTPLLTSTGYVNCAVVYPSESSLSLQSSSTELFMAWHLVTCQTCCTVCCWHTITKSLPVVVHQLVRRLFVSSSHCRVPVIWCWCCQHQCKWAPDFMYSISPSHSGQFCWTSLAYCLNNWWHG